jgi:sugar lactone lactonase YvrE
MSATPATGSIVFPQIGAGSNLSTQLVLINRSSQRIGGMIQLIGSDGMPLQFQLTKVSDREIACCPSSASLGEASAAVSSEFPYQIEADGVYRAQLNSSSGTAVGYAVVTLLQGSAAPAGSAIFQFTSNNRVVSEAGVAAVAPTTDARVFVDNRATRTGIAIASPDNPQTTVTFDLMGRSGDLIQRTTRVLPPRGHLPIFVDELFPDAPSNFTGLMEISSPVPVAPVTLKLSINQRNHPILTTLPIADLTRPVTATSLVFPQIGFGAGYSTSLIFIGTDKIRASTGSVSFFRDDGNGLTLPLGVQTDSRFPYRILPGGGVQLTPGQLVAVARIALDPFNPSAKEVIVNEGNIAQLRARALDSDGNIRDEITLAQSSLSPDVAFVDDLGKIQGKLRGFATLKVSGGGTEIRATITVVKVTSGAVVQRKRDKFAEAGFVITGIAQDLGGRVYLADSSDHTILLAPDLESTPALYAGVSQTPGFREDERLKALFQRPSFLALNQFDGSLYVSDSDNNVVRQVRPGPSGRADTLAGTRQAGSLDGPVNAATFNNPQGMALDDRGNLWIADSNNHTIRRISLDPSKAKTVETVAGRAGVAGAADGVGSAASFNFPAGIAVETESLGQQLAREATGDPPPPVSVIVADTGNGLLRRVKEDGTVETIGAIAAKRNVGRVTFPTSPTLPLTHSPTRPLPRSHTLSLPPSPTPPLSSSLTRPFAVSPLKFKSPTGVAVDPFGNIYVTEANSGQITALLRNGDIAAAAQANTFATPRGIAITRSGKVLVADSSRSNGEITYGEPSISSINPGRVSNKGGALVTISGRNFAPETVVIVGGVVANPQVLDTQTLTVIAPPLPSGRLTLTVQNRGGVAQKPLLVDPIPLSDLLPGQITTVAGGTTFTGDGGPATEATLFSPQQMAVDPAGNIFFTDANNNRIRKINAATGIITAVAGNGQIGFSGDGGPAIAASLAFPRGIAIDSAGNLYVADTANSRVRKIVAATGTITTVAGRGLGPFAGDGGPATQATLNAPRAVAIDGAGNLLIADTSNHRIRKVDAKTGIITTIAGTDPDFGGDNGPATAAALRSPQGIALDASGNVFVADTVNQRIRRIDAASKVITTVAGNGQAGFSGDLQSATSAMLNSPAGITVDVAGNLFIGDTANHRVRRVDASTRIITTVAGTGVQGFSGDGGPATQAALSSPYGVATDGAGNLLIVDQGNSRIRRVSAGTITTVAGNGQQSFLGDGGPATAANLLSPQGIAVDAAGNFFIADFGNQRIRKVTASTGIITTVAGTGIAGFLGDNVPAASSPLSSPTGVAIDGSGNLFISDSLNNRIRKVDGAGVITTVAGNGQSDFSGDNGPATAASLNLPQGIAIDRAGVLYVADTNHNRIRRVDLRSGIITTAVGGGSPSDRLGDNGPATDAALNSPTGIAVDSAGNLVIADSGNNRVRRVDAATGIITTVAGNGQASSSGDNGPATAAGLNHPVGVKFDAAGNLFVSEETRIRRVAAKTGVITTVAGNGISGFTGDNTQATNTALKLPSFLDFDPAGNLLFADTGNYRIRGIRAPIP